jgi:hypothetical protein
MDVLSRADDVRLGLYVVARLAAKLDVKVELRPSSFGGTRVVVLVPAELVLAEHQIPSSYESGEDDPELAPRLSVVGAGSGAASNGTAEPALNGVLNGSAGNADVQDHSDPLLVGVGVGGGGDGGGISPDQAAARPLEPLPRRVRQVSLVAELRETRDGAGDAGPHDDAETDPLASSSPGRSGATVGAFQRQSRRARLVADGEPPLIRPSSDAEQTREEDGR